MTLYTYIKSYIFITLICFSTITSAQKASGYLGKKNIITTSFNPMVTPAFLFLNDYVENYSLKPRINFKITRSINNNKSIEVSYSRNTFKDSLSYINIYKNLQPYDEDFSIINYKNVLSEYSISYIKFNRNKGAISPIGAYVKHTLNIFHFNIKDIEATEAFKFTNAYPDFKLNKTSSVSIGYGLAIGKNKILGNSSFVLNYEAGLKLNSVFFGGYKHDFFYYYDADLTKCFLNNTKYRVGHYALYHINLGLGYVF